MAERCPTCGAPTKVQAKVQVIKKGSNKSAGLFTGALIGCVAGLVIGHLLVVYYFGGGYTHPMALIHYASGAVLGGLIGLAAAFLFRR